MDSGQLPLVRNSAAQMDRMVHNTGDPAPAHTLGLVPEGTETTSSDAWLDGIQRRKGGLEIPAVPVVCSCGTL